jgi:hypothetical protein
MQFMTIFILTNIRKIGRNYVPLTLPSTALLPLSRSVTCCRHAPSLQNDRALYKTKSLEKKRLKLYLAIFFKPVLYNLAVIQKKIVP